MSLLKRVSALACCGAALVAQPAAAVIFDFSIDEFGISPDAAQNPVNRIFSSSPTGNQNIFQIGTVGFRVTARETNSGAGNPDPERPALFIPGIDLPPNGIATDSDLSVLGLDFEPIVNAALNGTELANPIGIVNNQPVNSPATNNSHNSLVVQNPGTNDFVNDFAPGGSNLGVLEFELLTANPVVLNSITFIDDVDARVFTSDNPGSDFIPSQTEIGEIQIDGIGSETLPPGAANCDVGGGGTVGDNCVAGLAFTDIVIEQGESFIVAFDGSGGVLGFDALEIPVPAALPLALTGLGALLFVGRRRRSSDA